MRIVNRKEFLQLPNNTLYCKYFEGGCLGNIHIKVDTWTSDFLSTNLQELFDFEDTNDLIEKLNKYEKDSSLEFKQNLEDCKRDGLFEEDQLFAIYNKEDIKKLISKLQELI